MNLLSLQDVGKYITKFHMTAMGFDIFLPKIKLLLEIFRNLVTAQGTRVSRNREEILSVFNVEESAGRDAGRFSEP